MTARTLRVLAVALALAPASASAQAWTEAMVAELAREGSLEARLASARSRRAWAAVEGAGLQPNPELGWERQEAFEPNAQTQDILMARVPLDLSGRPGARRALAELDAELEDAATAGARLDAVALALDAFYRALAAARRAAIFEDAQASLDEAVRVMASRQASGAASGYASSRLALEAELARSRLNEARIEAEAARRALGALLGVPAPAALEGELEAAAPPPLAALLERLGARPDLAALRRAERTAERAAGAADFAWIPRFELEGGYNRQDGPVVGHGYALGLSVEIPLFENGQAERARSAAARALTSEVRAALETRTAEELRVAHGRLVALLAERARFAESTGAATDILGRAAATGYREGERSLLDLLDARRALLEIAERGLALELAARQADVRLRRASGEL